MCGWLFEILANLAEMFSHQLNFNLKKQKLQKFWINWLDDHRSWNVLTMWKLVCRAYILLVIVTCNKVSEIITTIIWHPSSSVCVLFIYHYTTARESCRHNFLASLKREAFKRYRNILLTLLRKIIH